MGVVEDDGLVEQFELGANQSIRAEPVSPIVLSVSKVAPTARLLMAVASTMLTVPMVSPMLMQPRAVMGKTH